MPQTLPRNKSWWVILTACLAVIIGWNYWLPMAEDFYNLVTEANETRRFPLRNVDFFAYYNAGSRFENGQNPYFYTRADQTNFSDYIYPPTLLPVFGLISRMDYDAARLFWLGLNFTGYILSFSMLLVVTRRELRPVLLACGLVLTTASFPLLMHIHNGQSDLLVISLVLIGYVAYIKEKKAAAAFLLALAALTKVSPALFLIFFVLFLRDIRFLLYFIIAAVGMVLLSLLAVPFQLYLDYVLEVLPEVGKGTAYWLNQSIVKFVPASMGFLAQAIMAGGLGIFGLFTWWLSRRYPAEIRLPGKILPDTQTVAETVFFLNLLVILVFVGKAWSMVYVWTILPSALLVVRMYVQPPRAWYVVLVFLAVFLLVSKVYGYPILNSLNLWGSLLLASLLVLSLIKKEWVYPLPENVEQA